MPRIDVWDLERPVSLDCGFPRGREDHYSWGHELGKGGFGEVKVVTHLQSGRQYACKCIAKALQLANVSPVKRQQHLDNIKREVTILRKLRGTLNVVYLEDAFEDDTHVYLVMEWCKGGELIHAIGRRHYSERTVASFMRAVLRTLAQCHAHKILHRDIKPGNFMLLNESERSPVKAIDFGLAVFFDPQQLPRTDLGLEGTPWYMAPEVLSSETYPQSDVWAAGVMAFQLLSGKFPFDDWKNPRAPALSLVWRSILTEEPNFKRAGWENISDAGKDFVRTLLSKDPHKRPDAKQALQHPWLQGNSQQRSKGKPLAATIVQKLQRFGQVSVFKRTVLDMIANEVLASRVETLIKEGSRHGGSIHGSIHGSRHGPLKSPNKLLIPGSVHGVGEPSPAAEPEAPATATVTTFDSKDNISKDRTVPAAPISWSVHGPAEVDINKLHERLQQKAEADRHLEVEFGDKKLRHRVRSFTQLAKLTDYDGQMLSWSVHGGTAYKGPVKDPNAVINSDLHNLVHSLAYRRLGRKAMALQLAGPNCPLPTQEQLQLSPELRKRLEQMVPSPEQQFPGAALVSSPPADISLMYWMAKKQRQEQQKVARLALDTSAHGDRDYQRHLDEINGVITVGSYQDLSRVSTINAETAHSLASSSPSPDLMEADSDSDTPPSGSLVTRLGKAVKSVLKGLKSPSVSRTPPPPDLPRSSSSKTLKKTSSTKSKSKSLSNLSGSTPAAREASSNRDAPTGARFPSSTPFANASKLMDNAEPTALLFGSTGGQNGRLNNGLDVFMRDSNKHDTDARLQSVVSKLTRSNSGEEEELTARRSVEMEESGRRGHNRYAAFLSRHSTIIESPDTSNNGSHQQKSDRATPMDVDAQNATNASVNAVQPATEPTAIALTSATQNGSTIDAGRVGNGTTEEGAMANGAVGNETAGNGASSTPDSRRPSVDLSTIEMPSLLALLGSPRSRGHSFGSEVASPGFLPLHDRIMTVSRGSGHSQEGGLARLISDPVVRDETDRLLNQMAFNAQDKISREHFKNSLDDLGYQLEESELESLLAIMGTSEGEEDMLSRAAFIASQVDWADFQANYRDEWLKCLHQTFEGLDTDKDGRIRRQELVQLLADRLPEDEVNTAVEDALMEVAAEEEGLDFEGFMAMLQISSTDSLHNLDQYDSRNVCWGSVHGGDLLKPLKEEA